MSSEQSESASEIAPACLREHACAYLARFPATRAKLRKVLVRWAKRRGLVPSEQQLADLMENLHESGYLDDEKYALARARSLLLRGASLLDIRAKLGKDGIDSEQIRQTLDTLMEKEDREEVEILSALRVAQKKKLGPFRHPQPVERAQREKSKKKDIATLARKGFGWGVVKKIMQADDEELHAWQKKLQNPSR